MRARQSLRQFRKKIQNRSLGVKKNPRGSMINGKTPAKVSNKDILMHFYGGLYDYNFLVRHFGKFDKAFPKDPKIKPEADKTIIRQLQSKTGSGTYLLGGKLLGRAIIRGVNRRGIFFHHGFSKNSVTAWLKAYQHNWKKEGFDYNPIEPILKNRNGEFRIYKNKDGTYRVSTGLINGMSLSTYVANNAHNKIMMSVVKYNIEKLNKILTEKLKIVHGHLHDGNFVVIEEKVNSEMIPRLYIIDFDRAQIK